MSDVSRKTGILSVCALAVALLALWLSTPSKEQRQEQATFDALLLKLDHKCNLYIQVYLATPKAGELRDQRDQGFERLASLQASYSAARHDGANEEARDKIAQEYSQQVLALLTTFEELDRVYKEKLKSSRDAVSDVLEEIRVQMPKRYEKHNSDLAKRLFAIGPYEFNPIKGDLQGFLDVHGHGWNGYFARKPGDDPEERAKIESEEYFKAAKVYLQMHAR